MTTKEAKNKIEYLLCSLWTARDELDYAEKYERAKDSLNTEDDLLKYITSNRRPNGTVIRESLKQVSRLSKILADEVIYGKDSTGRICRGDDCE